MFDYKNVIKNRETRQKVLHCFDWLPDGLMVRLQYRLKTGRWPDLNKPKRFTEKLQWLKLNYRDPLMSQCANKLAVRDYVDSCGLSSILVPLIGVYSSPHEIDRNRLPDKFVLKDSLGGGGNEVLVGLDKNSFNWKDAIMRMENWVRPGRHRKHPGREWVYDTPYSSRILAEEFLSSDDPTAGLIEFKFFCSYGKPSYLYILGNRSLGESVELGIFRASDMSRVDAWRLDEQRLIDDLPQPSCYADMMDAASRLSKPFPEARVDFYYSGSRSGFRFSEITFFDGSGYFQFEPDLFDFELGAAIETLRSREGN